MQVDKAQSKTTISRAAGFYRVALKGTGWSIGKWDGDRWFLSGNLTFYCDADFDIIVEKPMSDHDLKREFGFDGPNDSRTTEAKLLREARAEGWQAANHAWQAWLDKNIPDWDAMSGIDLSSLPKGRK